jgi:lysophospholipase L1-like esterase
MPMHLQADSFSLVSRRALVSALSLIGCAVLGACAAPGSTSEPTSEPTSGPTSEPAISPPLSEPFRVLLLGDSISIGYTPVVEELLAGRAHVVRPRNKGKDGVVQGGGPENCAGTTKGSAQVDRWLGIEGGDWDVILFNFGLHDLKRVQPGSGKNSNDRDHPHQADPDRYRAQLQSITRRLKATGARLVFATTTPVPEGDLRPYREAADSVEYNLVASAVMAEEGVPVNDLFAFVTNYPEPILREANVHFTGEGSRALGERVANAILAAAGHGVAVHPAVP